MFDPPVFVKSKDSFFSFATLREINRSMHQFIPFSPRLCDYVTIGIHDAASGDERAMVLFAGLACVDAEAGICVAPRLATEAMVEQSLLLLL